MHLNERSLGPLMCVRVFGSGWQVEGRRGGGSRGFFPLHQQSSGPSGKHGASLPVTPRMHVCYVSPELWSQGQTGRRVWPLLAWSAEEMAIGLGCIWDRSRDRPGY